MEPSYKEIAEDLRYHYNKFIELWLKARSQGLSVTLSRRSNDTAYDYNYIYITDSEDAKQLKLDIYYKENF